MKNLINKPRVFLSHSKKDEAFIKRVHDDFMRCQITPWLDTFEIRHGKPWLDQIFESGLPTCDSVLVYLTENSIDSPVVKKEIDASIVTQLDNQKMSFLPYVTNESLREKLRPDIRALQVPVWNNENYYNVLAASVAEIWHSYLERTVENAVREEKTKRLELELEIEKRKSGDDIFSKSEEKDFTYIKMRLDYSEPVNISIKENKSSEDRLIYQFNVLSLITKLATKRHPRFYDRLINDTITDFLCSKNIIEIKQGYEIRVMSDIDLGDSLLMFGLVEKEINQKPYSEKPLGRAMSMLRPDYYYTYTPKMERFKYWLAYNNMFPTEIQFKFPE